MLALFDKKKTQSANDLYEVDMRGTISIKREGRGECQNATNEM